MKAIFSTIFVSCLAAASLAGVLNVDAKSNIYGAALASPPGTNPGILPPSVAVGGATSFQFSVTGLVNAFGGTPNWGPDGGTGVTNLNSSGGLSGIDMDRRLPLVGVFLAGSQPGSAPTDLDFTGGTGFASLSPELGQVFYIGDGLTGTGSGATQEFYVPVGATELYLGIADGFNFIGNPGYYDDNTGSFDVTYSAVPEPMTLGLLAVGALALRRKRK